MSQQRLNFSRLLRVSAAGILAWIVLGYFGGCNVAMQTDAYKGSYDAGGIQLAGVLVGLFAGLLFAWWEKPWVRSSRIRRFLRRVAYAGTWLVWAGLIFRGVWIPEYNWIPVNLPIRLDRKNTVSATFTAEMSARFIVQISLKPHLPFDDLDALRATWDDTNAPSSSIPPRPEIVWKVSNVSQDDQDNYWHSPWWGKTGEVGIGQFNAVRGKRYSITAEVVRPSPTVQVLDPHLQISSRYVYYMDYFVRIYSAMGFMVALGVGSILMIHALIKLRRRTEEWFSEPVQKA